MTIKWKHQYVLANLIKVFFKKRLFFWKLPKELTQRIYLQLSARISSKKWKSKYVIMKYYILLKNCINWWKNIVPGNVAGKVDLL